MLGNSQALKTCFSKTESATENIPPMVLMDTGKGEMVW